MTLPIGTCKGAPMGPSAQPKGLILRESVPAHQDTQSASQQGAEQVHFDLDAVDGQLCEISISHDAQLATAVAIVPHIGE